MNHRTTSISFLYELIKTIEIVSIAVKNNVLLNYSIYLELLRRQFSPTHTSHKWEKPSTLIAIRTRLFCLKSFISTIPHTHIIWNVNFSWLWSGEAGKKKQEWMDGLICIFGCELIKQTAIGNKKKKQNKNPDWNIFQVVWNRNFFNQKQASSASVRKRENNIISSVECISVDSKHDTWWEMTAHQQRKNSQLITRFYYVLLCLFFR